MSKTKPDFEQIAMEYMDFLYTHAQKAAQNMEQAEKMIQLTFERAFARFTKEDVRDYESWFLGILYGIAHRECLTA